MLAEERVRVWGGNVELPTEENIAAPAALEGGGAERAGLAGGAALPDVSRRRGLPVRGLRRRPRQGLRARPCRADAALCAACDADIHTANTLARLPCSSRSTAPTRQDPSHLATEPLPCRLLALPPRRLLSPSFPSPGRICSGGWEVRLRSRPWWGRNGFHSEPG
jgi:hypothetical protein